MKYTFEGGLNENDGTLKEECQEGSNFELVFGDSDFRPRRPLDNKSSSTFTGPIGGIMQLIKRDNTETTLIFDQDTPAISTWDGATTAVSKRTASLNASSKLRDTYYSLDDIIVISDIERLTPMLTWDGTDCWRLKTGLLAGSAQAVTSITRSGSTATVTTAGVHGYASGDLVHIAGANEAGYNGEYEITVTSTTTFVYLVFSSPASPATGTITVDFGVELYAKYAIIHNGRLWLFNVITNDGTSSDTPHLMVASEFENIESYNTSLRSEDSSFTTGNEAFYLLTQDLKPINGVALFNKQLVISTEDGRLYRLVGNDSTNYAWVDYYGGSAAIGTESMVNYGNDVAFMKKGGRIDTLIATDTSGDVSVDDISRWIPNEVKDLTDAIGVYDPDYQKVLFFVSNKVLVLFKDILFAGGGQISPWSIYKTELSFDFTTSAVRRLRRPGEATWSVYIGGSDGVIYDLNGAGSGDNGDTDIATVRKTNLIEDVDTRNGVLFGNVIYRRQGECQLNVFYDWSEEFNQTSAIITLKGPPAGDTAPYYNNSAYYGDTDYYNQGFAFADKVTKQNFSPSGRGDSFFMEISLTTSVRFKIDSINIEA